jgi:hypothetical protein
LATKEEKFLERRLPKGNSGRPKLLKEEVQQSLAHHVEAERILPIME